MFDLVDCQISTQFEFINYLLSYVKETLRLRMGTFW
jgi:hypothetical protein